MEGGKISEAQLTFLMVWTIVATGILFLPMTIGRHVTKEAWLVAVFFIAGTVPVALLVAAAGDGFQGRTVTQYARATMGRVGGGILSLVLIAWIYITGAIVLREFGEFMFVAMPHTPMLLISGIFIALSCYAVKLGVETAARLGEFFFAPVFFSITVVLVLVIKEADLKNMFPVFEYGVLPVIRASLTPLGYGGEILTALLIVPFLNRPRVARISLAVAVVIVGTIGLQIESLSTAVFGDLRERLVFPHFHLIRMISIGNILERVDALFMVIIIAGIFIKLTVFLYCGALSVAQFGNLRSHRPLVLPAGVIFTAFSNCFFDDINELVDFLDYIFPPFALSVEIGIPAALLISGYFKHKAG